MHFTNSMSHSNLAPALPYRRFCASALLVWAWAFLPATNAQTVGIEKPPVSKAVTVVDAGRGTFVGSIGDQRVMVCLDQSQRSACSEY